MEKISSNTSIYSWDDNLFSDYYVEDTLSMLKQLNVKRVYHSFNNLGDDLSKDIVFNIIENGQDVYALTGAPGWYSKPEKVIEQIDLIHQYNQKNSSHKIRGVVLDIEFYVDDAWDTDKNAVLNKTIETYQEVITYAHRYDIEAILCLPYWLDGDFTAQLEKLIQISDGISIMNYNRKIMKKGLEKEIEFTKKYAKPIDNISEFNPMNADEENLTFWYGGLVNALEEWKKLEQEFNYQRLTFSFHDLKALMALQKGYDYYTFDVQTKDGTIQKNIEIIFKVTKGNKTSYITKNSKDDGIIKIMLSRNSNYEIIGDDYQIDNISNIIEEDKQKKATITLGNAKTRYVAEIYFKYWNVDKNKYSGLKETSVSLRSLATNKEYTKITDASDGYAIFNLKHGDYYEIKINNGKSYVISFATENSNQSTFVYQQSEGTYLVPKIYLKEK